MADTTSPAGGADSLAPTQPTPTGSENQKTIIMSRAEGDTSIRPFNYHATDDELADLKRRIEATRWPEPETVNDQTQGVQLGVSQALAEYWASKYDWRRCEAQLNALPNFITEIDGLDIHFIHVRSKHENALPVIITHGWPGSVVEQMKIIGPLTDPTTHGGTAEDAFHVVVPSMPGYGFSGRPATTGWDPAHIARAWNTLMKRLGYTRYVAQGGDWGAIVTDMMGVQARRNCSAFMSTCRASFRATLTLRFSPAERCRPIFQTRKSVPASNSPSFTRKASDTGSSWVCVRNRWEL